MSAKRTLDYRIYVGAKNPQAWFAADPFINGVGKANETKLEGNAIYLTSSTKVLAQALTSGVEISDFALSGTQMLYSTPYGNVYGSAEQSKVAYYIPGITNAVGVIYAGNNTFYAVQVDGVIVGVDVTKRKRGNEVATLGESIRMVGNGPAEANLETKKMGTVIVGSKSLWVCDGPPLTCGKQNTDLNMDLIERVEFLQTGIVYLKNGTTLVLPRYLPSSDKRCLESSTVSGGFLRLKPLYVDRYSPTGPGGAAYFLRDGKVYSCASGEDGVASDDFPKTYEDFVGLADGAFWTTLDQVKLTKPEANAGVTTGYRFKYAEGAAVGVRKDYIPPFRAWADESAEVTYNNSALCI